MGEHQAVWSPLIDCQPAPRDELSGLLPRQGQRCGKIVSSVNDERGDRDMGQFAAEIGLGDLHVEVDQGLQRTLKRHSDHRLSHFGRRVGHKEGAGIVEQPFRKIPTPHGTSLIEDRLVHAGLSAVFSKNGVVGASSTTRATRSGPWRER
jgi:hypothetical protein